jgi:polysaccharide pyruvyl transferase WcaK-like protein
VLQNLVDIVDFFAAAKLINHVINEMKQFKRQVVFSLELPQTNSPSKADPGRRIAVGPIGYMKPQFWPEEDAARYEDYARKIVEFVRFLIDRGDTVVFVPGEAHYDQEIIGDILRRLGFDARAAERVERPKIESVADLIRVLSSVDIVVASRFHNLVLAHMLGKPTIALSYQEKINCLMRAAGLDAFCLGVSEFDVSSLKRHLAVADAQTADIRERLLRQSEDYRRRLASQYERVFALLGAEYSKVYQ